MATPCSISAATMAAVVAMISRNSPNAWRQIAAICLSRMILRLTNSATTVKMRCERQLGGCRALKKGNISCPRQTFPSFATPWRGGKRAALLPWRA
jgi:hypothetical protein